MASFAPKIAALVVVGVAPTLLVHRQVVHADEQHPISSSLSSSSSSSAAAAASPVSFAAAVAPQDSLARRHALPIYDAPATPATLLPAHSPLQNEVAQARRWLQGSYAHVQASARDGARTWIGWEGRAEEQVKALIAPDEDLMPGALYVAIATLTGSIVARNRNVLLRLTLPPTFLCLSLAHFLPKTAAIVGERAERVEQAYAPAIFNAQQKLKQWIAGFSSST